MQLLSPDYYGMSLELLWDVDCAYYGMSILSHDVSPRMIN